MGEKLDDFGRVLFEDRLAGGSDCRIHHFLRPHLATLLFSVRPFRPCGLFAFFRNAIRETDVLALFFQDSATPVTFTVILTCSCSART